MKRPLVALLFGGKSPEYEVSCRSAATIRDALLTAGYELLPVGISREGVFYLFRGSPERIFAATWEASPGLSRMWFAPGGGFFTDSGRLYRPDVIFPAVHGTGCEDGRLQGFLDTWGIPYVGCGVEASALAMNKYLAKETARRIGIPTLPEVCLTRDTSEETLRSLHYPLFLKPARSGSSVGASPVGSPEQLPEALGRALAEDTFALAEPLVAARELEVAVLDDGTLRVSAPGEVLTDRAFYDYETKYLRGTTRLAVPASLPTADAETLSDYARRLFLALGCRHLARVDFFAVGDTYYFNEINTLPGFTEDSMYPALAGTLGFDTVTLCDTLIRRALA